jgi:NAD(P)-dependent dehydrogenase (short-subunit alcohol dehydrogenase family)
MKGCTIGLLCKRRFYMAVDKSINGKVILITGGTDGIGKEAARQLAIMGATIVVVGRSRSKTKRIVDEIISMSGNDRVAYLLADLSSQSEIRKLAQDFRKRFNRLDVLVNNAGSVFLRRRLSADGIEMTFALNHLAYFLLTNLLLDLIKASAPSRIVNTSSGSHLGGKINFHDVNLSRRYFFQRAYAQSKLANVMFTFELASRLEGSGVTVNAVHPGFVKTNMGAHYNRIVRILKPLIFRTGIPVEDGAETLVYLASSPEVEEISGEYFYRLKKRETNPLAQDKDGQKRLWRLSEQMVGEF